MMKAKKVYEFRTSGEIVRMGKSEIIESEIDKWLKSLPVTYNEWSYKNEYLFIRSYQMFWELKPKHFIGCPVDKLIISTGLQITDDENNIGLKLPTEIYVRGDLSIYNVKNIIKIPKIIRANNNICIKYSHITDTKNKLEKLFCSESITIRNINIDKLPEIYYIESEDEEWNPLNTKECEITSNKYSKWYVDKELDISNTNISYLPEELEVRLNLYIQGTPITNLNNISVSEVFTDNKELFKKYKNDNRYNFYLY